MFKIDENNLKTSISEFFQYGHTVIDLLNHVLCDQALLEEYLALHKITPTSSKLPGLIVQVRVSTEIFKKIFRLFLRTFFEKKNLKNFRGQPSLSLSSCFKTL